VLAAVGAFLGQVQNTTVDANGGTMPGLNAVQDVVNSIARFGIVLCLGAMLVAAVIWAFGAQSQNHNQATQGKRGVLIAAGAAALIIASDQFINWAQGLGNSVS